MDSSIGRVDSGSVEAGGVLHLKVRTKEGSELDVELGRESTVNDLKQAIMDRLQLVDKNIRLIASGKLLDPPSSTLRSYKLVDGSYVHAVITDPSQHSASQSGNPSPITVPRVDMSNLRGLDTLMIRGPARNQFLSREEVAALRAYFHEDIIEHARENTEREEGETDVDFIYRCETEWMAAQSPSSEFRMNVYGRSLFSFPPALLNIDRFGTESSASSNSPGSRALQVSFDNDLNGTPSDHGTMRDFFYGLLMGFGCGYIMLFCMWDRNVSQRQKLGILAGMVLSLMFSLVMQEGRKDTSESHSGLVHGQEQQPTSTSGGGSLLPEIPIIDSGGLLPLPGTAGP
jgi:hypothetical protein